MILVYSLWKMWNWICFLFNICIFCSFLRYCMSAVTKVLKHFSLHLHCLQFRKLLCSFKYRCLAFLVANSNHCYSLFYLENCYDKQHIRNTNVNLEISEFPASHSPLQLELLRRAPYSGLVNTKSGTKMLFFLFLSG